MTSSSEKPEPNPDATAASTREPGNKGDSGGSSLGDGPPPKASGSVDEAGDQDRAATADPQQYGGGYGGLPRPQGSDRR